MLDPFFLVGQDPLGLDSELVIGWANHYFPPLLVFIFVNRNNLNSNRLTKPLVTDHAVKLDH